MFFFCLQCSAIRSVPIKFPFSTPYKFPKRRPFQNRPAKISDTHAPSMAGKWPENFGRKKLGKHLKVNLLGNFDRNFDRIFVKNKKENPPGNFDRNFGKNWKENLPGSFGQKRHGKNRKENLPGSFGQKTWEKIGRKISWAILVKKSLGQK